MEKKLKKGRLKLLLIILGAILLTVIVTGITIYLLIYGRIYTGDVPIVTREGTYTLPAYPTDITDESDAEATYPEETTDETSPSETSPIYSVDPKDQNIINILVIGCDSRNPEYDRGRSDTMLVLSYNTVTKQVSIISLLRDCLVPIEGYGWNRLNAAYAFGGTGLCINTINQVFDLDIQNYIKIDFNGFVKVIDEIDGIEINLTQAEADYYNEKYGWGVSAGKMKMNGEQALLYARNRTVGGSDFARTERQRNVIIAVMNKALSGNINNTISLIDKGLEYVETNLSIKNINSLAYNVLLKGVGDVKTGYVPNGGTYSNAWYKGMLILKIDIKKNAEYVNALIYG